MSGMGYGKILIGQCVLGLVIQGFLKGAEKELL